MKTQRVRPSAAIRTRMVTFSAVLVVFIILVIGHESVRAAERDVVGRIARKIVELERDREARCPADMVSILGAYCIDRHEAFVNEIRADGSLKRHSPFYPLAEHKRYMAFNKSGRMPQAHINQRQAAAACKEAGKRLCSSQEWVGACKGKKPTIWPYGDDHQPKRCNDSGKSPMHMFYSKAFGGRLPKSAYTRQRMNDHRFNRALGTGAPSGKFQRCSNTFRVYDMVGNLHEWVADPGGTFRGGYYLDVMINGNGCEYKTTAHHTRYYDYSTGFRCCR
jgi:sulfatase modifying factor 1